MTGRIAFASGPGGSAALAGSAHAEAPIVLFDQGRDGSGWVFGIGTGLSSFSLDGDLGFATSEGGVIGGLRNIALDWEIKLRDPDLANVSVHDVDEDSTDLIVGVTHTMPIGIGFMYLWSTDAEPTRPPRKVGDRVHG